MRSDPISIMVGQVHLSTYLHKHHPDHQAYTEVMSVCPFDG